MITLHIARRASLFAAASLLAFATAAAAQNSTAAQGRSAPATPASATPAADQPSQGYVGEVVVTARRRSESLKDVPFAVSVTSGAQLVAARIETTTELNAVAPGLTMSRQGSFVQPTIRGIGSQSGGPGQDAAIPIYLDGLYLSSQVGNAFDLADISNVQVLKGPQGTLFGRNATGGLILIETRDPSFTPGGQLNATYGRFLGAGSSRAANKGVFSGYVTGPLSESLAGTLSAYVSRQGGYYTDDHTGTADGSVHSVVLRSKLLYKPTDRLSFLLSGMYANRYDEGGQLSFPFNGNTADKLIPGAIVPTEPWHVAVDTAPLTGKRLSFAQSKIYQGSLRIDLDLGSYHLRSLTGYTRVYSPASTDLDGGYSGAACLLTFQCLDAEISEGAKTFQQELTLSSPSSDRLSYVAGLFYYNDLGYQNSILNGFLSVNGRVRTMAYAPFGEATFKLTDKLKIVGGLRYSFERRSITRINEGHLLTVHFDAWTPKASLIYSVSDQTNVYATYSRGFKSGIINHGDTPITYANPEFITSYEVGLKTSTRGIAANLSLFYYDYKDLQVSYFTGLGLATRNAANARIYGGEIETTAQLTPELTAKVGVSYLPHAEYKNYQNAPTSGDVLGPFGYGTVVLDASGLRILRSPKLTADASLEYSHEASIGRFDASVNLYYSSSYHWDLNPRFVTSKYATLAATISFTPTNSPLTISVYGKNLTNRAYIVSGLTDNLADLAGFGSPAEVGVTLGYKLW